MIVMTRNTIQQLSLSKRGESSRIPPAYDKGQPIARDTDGPKKEEEEEKSEKAKGENCSI